MKTVIGSHSTSETNSFFVVLLDVALFSYTSHYIFPRRDVLLLTEDKPRHMYASMAYSLGLHYHVYVPQRFPASYNNETYPPVLVEIPHFKEFFLRLLKEVV
jgi:hypothetical protein